MTDRPGPPLNPSELKFEDGHPMVLAYRVGQVEHTLNQIVGKLDLIAQNYPTTATIQLLLDPLKGRVAELEEKNKQEETAKNAMSAQLKLAVIICAVSPIFTIVVTFLLTGVIK